MFMIKLFNIIEVLIQSGKLVVLKGPPTLQAAVST